VSAEGLLRASRVAERAVIRDVHFLERADVPDFVCDTLTAEQLAGRAAWTLWTELQPFLDIAVALNSAGGGALLPRPQDLHASAVGVLHKALANVSPQRLQIPVAASPDALTQWLRDRRDAG
jgi:hypothetical protein